MTKHPDIKWWYAKDFMQPDLGECFVGYEATARLSELAQEYPLMIESQKDGRFMKRRFRFEAVHEFYDDLPDRMKCIMWDAGLIKMEQVRML